SGLALREDFSKYNAEVIWPIEVEKTMENKACRCAQVLTGLITPNECPLFKKICTPESPVGACMVSSEGTCAAYYKYGDISQ
ncbi:MAG TPA: hydrogenase formation protein HypD, partial [bacterium]|nr:hydrogenase formation protein HypD [bacterium]